MVFPLTPNGYSSHSFESANRTYLLSLPNIDYVFILVFNLKLSIHDVMMYAFKSRSFEPFIFTALRSSKWEYIPTKRCSHFANSSGQCLKSLCHNKFENIQVLNWPCCHWQPQSRLHCWQVLWEHKSKVVTAVPQSMKIWTKCEILFYYKFI